VATAAVYECRMENTLAQAILCAIALPAVFVARDEKIVMANDAAVALLGPGLVGRHFALSLRQPQAIGAIEAALRRGAADVARLTIRGAGTERVYQMTSRPIAGGGQSGTLCLFEDVSDAEHIGLMRREFVANVSHELRTPLTALSGFIETLQGAAKDDPAARARFLGIMARETDRMNRLVNDLLQLSQVEANERRRPEAPVDLAGCIRSTVSTLRPMADQLGMLIALTGLDAPLMVPGDADQMVQVFQNLIENALKYTRRGTVHVGLTESQDGMLGPVVAASVRDEGEGIDPLHLPRLTERFYRIDSHRSREQGGTGLGLAIVKHIVNRHRGRLQIESVQGVGSCFTVVLPKTI
jgi:two-component system, OmpR family, phosphate regulon sensor histidine kinase PhoR